MRLIKIHRVISFAQARWMEPYISMNKKMRAAAKNEMENDFPKLMNNAVYGKTCEKQRKRTDIHLITDMSKAAKLIIKPHLLNVRMFHENLMGLELQKVKLLLIKPSYVGFVVLELSKRHMMRYCPFLFPEFH